VFHFQRKQEVKVITEELPSGRSLENPWRTAYWHEEIEQIRTFKIKLDEIDATALKEEYSRNASIVVNKKISAAENTIKHLAKFGIEKWIEIFASKDVILNHLYCMEIFKMKLNQTTEILKKDILDSMKERTAYQRESFSTQVMDDYKNRTISTTSDNLLLAIEKLGREAKEKQKTKEEQEKKDEEARKFDIIKIIKTACVNQIVGKIFSIIAIIIIGIFSFFFGKHVQATSPKISSITSQTPPPIATVHPSTFSKR
jgi:transcription-repair coupling factor (superfamily II helicase)